MRHISINHNVLGVIVDNFVAHLPLPPPFLLFTAHFQKMEHHLYPRACSESHSDRLSSFAVGLVMW